MRTVRRFKAYIAACVLSLILILCVGSSAVAAGAIGGGDLDKVMAMPDGYFLSADGDPNYSEFATVNFLNDKAIGSLVEAYRQSKDQKYARRLALVLYRLSRDDKTLDPDEYFIIEMTFLQGYLAVKDSAAAKKLSAEMKVDIAKAIEDNLIRSMVDALLQAPQDSRAFDSIPGNIARICLVGRAINEPEYVRATYRYLSEFHDYNSITSGCGFTFDMHGDRGVERHLDAIKHVNSVLSAIDGYSDPAGFTDVQRHRLDNISLKDFPCIEKMLAVLPKYSLPDGQMNLLGNSTAIKVSEPREESINTVLAGFGHAVLGAGKDKDQSQVQLHFSEHFPENFPGKSHKDCLSMVWYGHERLMSGEIGGQINKLRSWAASSLTHNTVVVDRQNQSNTRTAGNVLLNVSNLNGLSVIQIDGTNAYSDLGVKKYRRMIIHNTIDETRPYFVDIFEVDGGTVHDYSIHGSVLGDMTGDCSLEMLRLSAERPMLEDGEKWVEPGGVNEGYRFTSSEYGLFRRVDKSKAIENFNVTFACKDDKTSGTRIHMLADPSMEVFLGESPALRLAGNFNDDNVYNWKMPHLIARRTGKTGLKSTFIAVYDMFKDGPKIKSVKRLFATDAYISLEIVVDNRIDKLFLCLEGPRSMIGGGVQMKGRLGLVSEKDGFTDGYLIGGTLLRKSPMMVRLKKASYAGRILTTVRNDNGRGSNAFTVGTILPTGHALRDKWMIVTHRMSPEETADIGETKQKVARHAVNHAYQIDRVERVGAKIVVYLKEDHGLNIAGEITTELYSPRRTFTGSNRFIIYTHAKGLSR